MKALQGRFDDVCEAVRLMLAGDYDRAKEHALRMKELFEENYYVELQDHGIAEQKRVNSGVVKLSRELGIPLVATNDAHYLTRRDADNQAVLLCIQTGNVISDEPGLYIKEKGIGIRIEDDLLITENGAEVLTEGILKEVSEIEQFYKMR